MATYQQLSNGSPDGCILGSSASELVGFYGATPVNQPDTIASVTTASIATVTTTAATSTTDGWGYTTSTQADAIVTAVNSLITRAGVLTTQGNAYRTALIELGLIASA
jgi:hypothetical protein